ncbi:amidohydrolase [Vogesella amnigena]|uniref:Amidohydrolase n=1 Tax=Vogesella amnigena TaxID=1507449 RepID=A0ABV7TWL0_9NEIS
MSQHRCIHTSLHPLALAVFGLTAWQTVAAEPAADTVFRNGYVYTVDRHDSVRQAVAVKDGRIVFVGSNQELARYIGPQTRQIDLQGRMLMPGLVDGHVHPLTGGEGMTKCSLDYKPFTVAQMQEKIRGCLADKAREPDSAWLEVVNWDRQATVKLDRDPVKADLDALSQQRPIIVTSIDNHSRLNNSKALQVSGIKVDTPNPTGGVIGHTTNGELSGMLEDGAVLLSDSSKPQPSSSEQLHFARLALDKFSQAGVTTFLSALSDEAEVKVFSELRQQGALSARAQFAIKVTPEEAARPAAAVAGVKAMADKYNTDVGIQPGIRVSNIKLWMDGVLQAPAQTARLLAPYRVAPAKDRHAEWLPGKHLGEGYFSQQQVNDVVLQAAQQGLDVHMHAIGDATVRQALNAVANTRNQPGLRGFRPAIAHAELVDPADYHRFRQLNTTAVMSFQWAQRAPYSVEAVEKQLGKTRYAHMEPEGSLRQANTRIAYGSDWPVDPMAYFYNLRVGVTRSGDPQHPAGFGQEYRGRLNLDPLLSRADVVRAITMNAAYALRMEQQVGSIEPGKYADLIVLDKNFMRAPLAQLAHTRVLLTMVGGKAVWSAPDFQ